MHAREAAFLFTISVLPSGAVNLNLQALFGMCPYTVMYKSTGIYFILCFFKKKTNCQIYHILYLMLQVLESVFHWRGWIYE